MITVCLLDQVEHSKAGTTKTLWVVTGHSLEAFRDPPAEEPASTTSWKLDKCVSKSCGFQGACEHLNSKGPLNFGRAGGEPSSPRIHYTEVVLGHEPVNCAKLRRIAQECVFCLTE